MSLKPQKSMLTRKSTATEAVLAQLLERPAEGTSDATAGGGRGTVASQPAVGNRHVKKHTADVSVSAGSQSGEPISLSSLLANGLVTTIIPDRLYFTSIGGHPRSTDAVLYFTTDFHLVYTPYFADFGPLHVGCVVRFCRILWKHLQNPKWKDQRIVYYSGHGAHQRANAAALIAGFCILSLGMTAHATCALFEDAYPPLLPFRDASYGISTFNLTLCDCMQGLEKAKLLGWIDVNDFDADAHDHYDAIENGDWNWLVPRQVIAFSSPVDGVEHRQVTHVAQAFRENKVRLVLRLNENLYDRRQFQTLGIEHVDLEYPDGSVPTDSVVNQCLQLMEKAILKDGGAAAIHCKAGLGRTGTIIAVYVMKHFGFTAREVIAWCRLCRPGSVIGPQQQYLEQVERRFDRGPLLAARIRETAQRPQRGSQAKTQPTQDHVVLPLPSEVMQQGSGPVSAASGGRANRFSMPNASVVATAMRLPLTITAAQRLRATLEANASMYDPTYVSQDATLGRFKYSSSKTDALKAAKSPTRKAMKILDGSCKRRTHASESSGDTAQANKDASTARAVGGRAASVNASNNVRSASQLSCLSASSAVATLEAIGSFFDTNIRKHPCTTGDVANVLPDVVVPPSQLGLQGPGWLRPTEHPPRAHTSLW